MLATRSRVRSQFLEGQESPERLWECLASGTRSLCRTVDPQMPYQAPVCFMRCFIREEGKKVASEPE